MTQTTEKKQTKKRQTNEKRQTGYVYALRSYQTDDIYIGSTFGVLRQRLYQHKKNLEQYNAGKQNYITSYEIVKFDDAFIEMIEKYENVNKMELHKHEGVTIRNTGNCVNKNIAGGKTKEEMKHRKHELYLLKPEETKQIIKQRAKVQRAEVYSLKHKVLPQVYKQELLRFLLFK